MQMFCCVQSLVTILVTAASVYADRFHDFHQTQMVNAGPINLNGTSYRMLTETPRDYSVATLLTALDQRLGCKMCVDFNPEWNLLARSWALGDSEGSSRLVLATLDFADGREVFTSLGLNTAPVLLFMPPTHGPYAVVSQEPIRYDFSAGIMDAEHIRSWLSRHLPGRPHPEIKRPLNFIRLGYLVVCILSLFTGVVALWPRIQPVIHSKNLWAGVCLTAILIFTSGHMFNQIRGVPYMAGDGRGGVRYFSTNFQSQFGMETQIIAGLYGVLAFSAISLATRVPNMSRESSRTLAAIVYSVILLAAYSLLLRVFRIKNSGYPFSLPPFL